MAILCASLISGCGSTKIREEVYVPSQEVIHNKSDLPVIHLWDRWNESADQDYLVDGNKVIQSSRLVRFLSEDPSAEVVAKLNRAERWRTVSAISGTLGGVAVLVGALGFIKNDQGVQSFATSTNLILLGLGAIGIGGGLLANGASNCNVEEAISLHNARIWKQADRSSREEAVTVALKVAF